MKDTYTTPEVEIKVMEPAAVIAASGDGWNLPGYGSGIFNW